MNLNDTLSCGVVYADQASSLLAPIVPLKVILMGQSSRCYSTHNSFPARRIAQMTVLVHSGLAWGKPCLGKSVRNYQWPHHKPALLKVRSVGI